MNLFSILSKLIEEKNIPLAKIISVATDKAPAMVNHHHCFIAFLSREVPDILCSLHDSQTTFTWPSDRLHQSLRHVTSTVDKIRSNALNN